MAQQQRKQRKLTICVEGNIASGKTTLLDHFVETVPEVEVVAEPVDLWQNVSGCNLLELMYKDPKRWSYTFQTYTLLTMMRIHSREQQKEQRVIERSAYSAVYCFVENLYQSGNISKLEYTVHHQWFDWLKEVQKPKIDVIMYIQTPPEKCLERLKERGRKEEQAITLDFLQQLDKRYEDWLLRSRFEVPAPVKVVNGDQSRQELARYYHEIITDLYEKQSLQHTNYFKYCHYS